MAFPFAGSGSMVEGAHRSSCTDLAVHCSLEEHLVWQSDPALSCQHSNLLQDNMSYAVLDCWLFSNAHFHAIHPAAVACLCQPSRQ